MAPRRNPVGLEAPGKLSNRAPGGDTSVTMRLDGGVSAGPRGEAETGGVANYYRTQDRANWKPGIPLFGAVRYPAVYPGIDAVFHGNKEELEFDFEIQPGGNPEEVRLAFEGADRVSIAQDGGLDVFAGGQTWHLASPAAH